MNSKKALLFIGSPHGFNSSSNSLGTYLLDKLQSGGYETSKIHAQAAIHNKEKQAEMLSQVADSDILILAFPLYVDSLPAGLILALEKIAEDRKNGAAAKHTRVLAIVNNGFPDAKQNATAIAICKQFANEVGYEWAGGLTMGAGAMINGMPLEKAPMIKNIKKSLDLTAKSLLEGSTVPEEAMQLMAKPVMPNFIMTRIANMGWKNMAKPYGNQKKLRDRPIK
ncbi:MAG: NAD(P)H-dependent oxidoreductase [Candidatus Bathyarchaeota archaeon]|nr:NAD(P)H-dependent oxidoreductase [Candidatus Bathyarchaeota archaeon]